LAPIIALYEVFTETVGAVADAEVAPGLGIASTDGLAAGPALGAGSGETLGAAASEVLGEAPTVWALGSAPVDG
jgi:hypothetical protein